MAEVFKTFAISLDAKVASYAKIPVVEGDTGNRFVITLTDDGTAVDLSTSRVVATFSGAMGTRSQDSWTSTDGLLVISGASHNIITFDLLNGSYASGLNTCELQVYSGATYTRLVTSASFTFNARKPILNDTTITSTTEYPILVSLIDQVESLTDREQADWDETDDTKGTFINNKPVIGTDIQAPTNTLTVEATLANDDTFPFYDENAMAHRKSTWANIVATITALFRSIFMPYDATSTNLVIDGNFNVNQRAKSGTVTLAAGVYGHDRWKAGASGCTYAFAISENVTTLTISAGSLIQVVEGINLRSGTVCLSWTGTAQGKIGAGSYSASGVTRTATGGTNLNIEFNSGTLSNVQLNYGSVALPFVPRIYADEFKLCARYYAKITGAYLSGYTFGGTNHASVPLVSPMRIDNPTVTIDSYFICNGDVQACTSGTTSSATSGMLSITQTGSTLMSAYPATLQVVTLTADAEL